MCCLLVFESVTSAPQWIRQPKLMMMCDHKIKIAPQRFSNPYTDTPTPPSTTP